MQRRVLPVGVSVGRVIGGQAIFAQILEKLRLVNSVDVTVFAPQELLGMAVVIGDEPVDHLFALDLLDLTWRSAGRWECC